jgi:hypothetical protein
VLSLELPGCVSAYSAGVGSVGVGSVGAGSAGAGSVAVGSGVGSVAVGFVAVGSVGVGSVFWTLSSNVGISKPLFASISYTLIVLIFSTTLLSLASAIEMKSL